MRLIPNSYFHYRRYGVQLCIVYLYWNRLSTIKLFFLKIECIEYLNLNLNKPITTVQRIHNNYNKHGPKILGEAGSPSSTKSPGLRSTSIPSGILIHPAIWPQQIWAKHWRGLCPFGEGELGLHPTQCDQGRGLPAWQVSC